MRCWRQVKESPAVLEQGMMARTFERLSFHICQFVPSMSTSYGDRLMGIATAFAISTGSFSEDGQFENSIVYAVRFVRT
jgi:hypothetical protein